MPNDSERSNQRRAEERIEVALPVKVGQATGVTHDLSASGIFFEIDDNPTVGSEIGCQLELNTPTGKFILKCQGMIVRTENKGGKTGVAIRITDSTFSTDDLISV